MDGDMIAMAIPGSRAQPGTCRTVQLKGTKADTSIHSTCLARSTIASHKARSTEHLKLMFKTF